MKGEWDLTQTVFDDWPRDPVNGRFLCAPTHPMPKNASGRWSHTTVGETDHDSDYSIEYKCKDCGLAWREEMPD